MPRNSRSLFGVLSPLSRAQHQCESTEQRRQEKVEDIETPQGTEAKIEEEIAQNGNTVAQLREARI